MFNRRKFLAVSTAATISMTLPRLAIAADLGLPLKATAVTEVFGNGMRLVGIALEYAQRMEARSLALDDFMVGDRTVTDILTS